METGFPMQLCWGDRLSWFLKEKRQRALVEILCLGDFSSWKRQQTTASLGGTRASEPRASEPRDPEAPFLLEGPWNTWREINDT